MAGVSAGKGAVNSLIGKLTALLGDEYNLLKKVRKEIEFLKRELRRMQAYLDELADMEILDKLTKDRRDNLCDLSYEMEDCIDRFMDRLGSGNARQGFVKRTARRLKTLRIRHGLATLIKELKARAIQESERNERYKAVSVTPARSCPGHPDQRAQRLKDLRITTLHEEARELMAMDGPVKHISTLLMDEKEMKLKLRPLKVVAIVGSGGLGKTTLAMEVYRKIGADFQCKASVSVSRTLDLENLLKDVLSQIDQGAYRECQLHSWRLQQLIPKIKQILTEKRYFIVIDDVWKKQDWKLVKAAFPDNNNGSRIIATTRITGVANMCCSNFGDQLYQMSPLDDDHSRKLFLKKIFKLDDFCPTELEEVSTRILKKCGGLPLAIITFASLLASKAPHKYVWERLEDSIGTGSSLEDDENLKVMEDILLLSYWDLPHYLKPCLLYLCIYPEDYKISSEEVKWKWKAEGYIADQQVADHYFNELVNRNMIQPVDVKYDGIVKKFRVHDMVLDLIIFQSHQENFAAVLNGRVSNSFRSKIRRLSMQFSGKEYNAAVSAITETKLHVRSLTMFNGVKQIPPIVNFHALRVLDFIGCHWLENKHVKHIGSSRQLRYLRICSRGITELPDGIGKLQHLETLDLRECYYLPRLPSTVAQLQKLVRLFLSVETQLPATVFWSLQALEKLCYEKTDDPVRFAKEINESGECNLRYLRTVGEIAERLFCNPCFTYRCLQVLKIESDIGKVPRGMVSLENLVELRIWVRDFDKEGLQVLMGMPSLAHLQLLVRGGITEKLTIGSNGFKLLKVFEFVYTSDQDLSFLKDEPTGGLRVTFASGAVPALRHLGLELSPMFVKSDFFADLGVEHLPALAHLEVKIYCYRALQSRVVALESSVVKEINLHPNREIRVRRVSEYVMFKDKEWEENRELLKSKDFRSWSSMETSKQGCEVLVCKISGPCGRRWTATEIQRGDPCRSSPE